MWFYVGVCACACKFIFELIHVFVFFIYMGAMYVLVGDVFVYVCVNVCGYLNLYVYILRRLDIIDQIGICLVWRSWHVVHWMFTCDEPYWSFHLLMLGDLSVRLRNGIDPFALVATTLDIWRSIIESSMNNNIVQT